MFVKENTRKLARIVTIDDIKPIEKADRLEIAVVGGWECIVQKDMYKKDDLAVYFEIDASIPLDSEIWGDFDKKYLTIKKDENGKEYAVIKTLRMRGVLSQGLVLRIDNLYSMNFDLGEKEACDLTQTLKVLKYVSPEEAKLYVSASNDDKRASGWIWKFRNWLTKGIVSDGLMPFPYGHVKSDEERVQNRSKMYDEMAADEDTDCEVTIKFDGESATFYTDLDTGEIGVAQRNYALRINDVAYTFSQSLRVYLADWVRFIARRSRGGACDVPVWKKGYIAQSIPLVRYFYKTGIAEKIKHASSHWNISKLPFCAGNKLSIQGEMIGPDFNGNKENVKENQFYMYRAYSNGSLLHSPEQARLIAKELGVCYVPVIEEHFKLPKTIQEVLKLADGPGHFDPKRKREGVVVKANNSTKSFKIISNKWLEKAAKEDS